MLDDDLALAQPPPSEARIPGAIYAELLQLVERIPARVPELIAFARRLAAESPAPAAESAESAELVAERSAWTALGYELGDPAVGPHRLRVALRAVRAVTGGGGVSRKVEAALATWFASIVRQAIRRGGLGAATAIHALLVGDWQRDPIESRPARCPAVAAIGRSPLESRYRAADTAAFLVKVREAAAGYVRTVLAGASDFEVAELCELAAEDDAGLERFRPWGFDLIEGEPAAQSLDRARCLLTQRHLSNADACSGFESWAHGFATATAEYSIPPVNRLGAIAWLARVALRDEEDAAWVARVALRDEEDAA